MKSIRSLNIKTSSRIILIAAICLFESCSTSKKTSTPIKDVNTKKHASAGKNIPVRTIHTKNVSPDELVAFAETLTGIKYKYGSSNKEQGFDCSGFITYVFTHFNIAVPRSSVEFTNAGKQVGLSDSRKGDLILFTGSDTTGWIVGHMGIITENKKGKIAFIHSASGNNKGVMISGMSNYFVTRFVKVIRVFD